MCTPLFVRKSSSVSSSEFLNGVGYGAVLNKTANVQYDRASDHENERTINITYPQITIPQTIVNVGGNLNVQYPSTSQASISLTLEPGNENTGEPLDDRDLKLNASVTAPAQFNNQVNTGGVTATGSLEMHGRGKLDGTCMPNMSIWVDVQNSEIYLKFKEHLDKVMELAVQVEQYAEDLRQRQKNWPWSGDVGGVHSGTVVTQHGGDVLLPDVLTTPNKVGMTIEEYVTTKQVTLAADWHNQYGKQAQNTGLNQILFTNTWTDPAGTTQFLPNTIITLGMRLYRNIGDSWT